MLSRFLLLSFFVLIYSGSIDAQTCYGGEFTTQAEVDLFLANNPTCTTIDGGLRINSGTTDPINNLNAFGNITSITSGEFSLTNTQITTLGNLQNANFSTYVFNINNNPNLLSVSLSGNFNGSQLNVSMPSNSVFNFSGNFIGSYVNTSVSIPNNGVINFNGTNITSSSSFYASCPNGIITASNNFTLGNQCNLSAKKVSGFNYIQNNNNGNPLNLTLTVDTLIGFNGLVNLTEVSLFGSLNSLTGFASLSTCNQVTVSTNRVTPPLLPPTLINRIIYIHHCANFQNLVGLGLNSSTRGLSLTNNPRLKSLAGAEALERLSYIGIGNNDSLTTLAGLNQVVGIENSLNINSNDRLSDISSLNSIKLIEGSVSIQSNPLLNNCCILAALRNKNRIGTIYLTNNGPNCSTTYNLLEVTCLDSDLDGIFDTTDNCDLVSNPNQLDNDGDGIGNLCDNCPNVSNPNQEDSDGNNIGNACQTSPIDTVSIENGDLYIKDPQLGLIIKSIDGLCYRIKVDGSGQVIASLITCPN